MKVNDAGATPSAETNGNWKRPPSGALAKFPFRFHRTMLQVIAANPKFGFEPPEAWRV